MATALLYNIPSQKINTLRVIFLRLGLKVKQVTQEEYSKPLGALLFPDFQEQAENSPISSFSEEMLVLGGISDKQLDVLLSELRRKHIILPLKAVLTSENIHWSSLRLYAELTAERQAINENTTAHK